MKKITKNKADGRSPAVNSKLKLLKAELKYDPVISPSDITAENTGRKVFARIGFTKVEANKYMLESK